MFRVEPHSGSRRDVWHVTQDLVLDFCEVIRGYPDEDALLSTQESGSGSCEELPVAVVVGRRKHTARDPSKIACTLYYEDDLTDNTFGQSGRFLLTTMMV